MTPITPTPGAAPAGSPPDGAAAHTTEPSIFVIIGATGDLAKRKILPALFELHRHGMTDRGCVILGVARDAAMDDAGFRAIVRDAIPKDAGAQGGDVSSWIDANVFYQPIGNAESGDFVALKTRIEGLEHDHNIPGKRSFYLSLPPEAFPPTIAALGAAGLNHSSGWTRLVIEKPFGRDLPSAEALNRLVHQYFDESQVYRIDHYLGKETVQNLLVFRFANAMFESLWNRDHIESVEITVAEELGVEQRAGYYEHAGALRDMVQSHLTQLLALVAMEVPTAFEAGAIREEKIKALRSIAPMREESAVFGQYTAGRIDGQAVAGYRQEPGVSPSSNTETFVALRMCLDNWRWQGVPFYLRTGKRLARRLTEIRVQVPAGAGLDVPLDVRCVAAGQHPGHHASAQRRLPAVLRGEGAGRAIPVAAPHAALRLRRSVQDTARSLPDAVTRSAARRPDAVRARGGGRSLLAAVRPTARAHDTPAPVPGRDMGAARNQDDHAGPRPP